MQRTAQTDRLQEKVASVCLIAAALLLAPTTYFEYGRGLLFGAGALGVLVYALFIPGLLGVARLLRQGAPRLSVVAGLLATTGCVGAAAFQAALLHEWAARSAGTSEALMTAILTTTEERVFPALVIFSIQFPISLLVLSIGLFRTRVTPAWAAGMLGIGAILFPVGHIGSLQLVQHLAETLLLIPMLWLGVRSFATAPPRGVAAPAAA